MLLSHDTPWHHLSLCDLMKILCDDDDGDDDDCDDEDGGDDGDLYIMVKCVCVCHEKVTKFV